MTTRLVPILSSSDPDDPRPWFRFTFDPDTLTSDITEANGLRAFSEREVAAGRRGAALSAQRQGALRRSRTHLLATGSRGAGEEPTDERRPRLADELHVLAVTLEGEVEFVPASRQRPIYYAHLAWYDPLSGELTVLDFAEPVDG